MGDIGSFAASERSERVRTDEYNCKIQNMRSRVSTSRPGVNAKVGRRGGANASGIAAAITIDLEGGFQRNKDAAAIMPSG